MVTYLHIRANTPTEAEKQVYEMCFGVAGRFKKQNIIIKNFDIICHYNPAGIAETEYIGRKYEKMIDQAETILGIASKDITFTANSVFWHQFAIDVIIYI